MRRQMVAMNRKIGAEIGLDESESGREALCPPAEPYGFTRLASETRRKQKETHNKPASLRNRGSRSAWRHAVVLHAPVLPCDNNRPA